MGRGRVQRSHQLREEVADRGARGDPDHVHGVHEDGDGLPLGGQLDHLRRVDHADVADVAVAHGQDEDEEAEGEVGVDHPGDVADGVLARLHVTHHDQRHEDWNRILAVISFFLLPRSPF